MAKILQFTGNPKAKKVSDQQDDIDNPEQTAYSFYVAGVISRREQWSFASFHFVNTECSEICEPLIDAIKTVYLRDNPGVQELIILNIIPLGVKNGS